MIFKGAVDAFLNRKRRDLRRRKRWSVGKVARCLKKLSPRPEFITKPRLSQKVGFLIGAKYENVFFMFDMGLGKTKLTLDLIRYRWQQRLLRRVLVLVPNVVNIEGWRQEMKVHAPDLEAVFITGTPEEKQAAWCDTSSIVCVCTYSGLHSFLCSKKKKGWEPNQSKLRKGKMLFDGLVMDESQALMNIHSLRYRCVKALSADFAFRICLSGTPFGRDPMVLWPQFYLLDRGETLGETYGLFRDACFDCEEGYFGGRDYKLKRGMKKKIRRMISHSSIYYSTEECVDLPDRVDTKKPFVLSEEQRIYYEALLEGSGVGEGKASCDVGGLFVRLRQVVSGFVSLEGVPSSLSENPKLELLRSLIEEIPKDEKIIIFNEFIYSGDLIQGELREMGVGCARLYSKTRSKSKVLLRFTTDPDCRVFLVNSQSGAQGLNLQGASYVIFYESPVSPIVRQQAEKRCHRPGQEKTVFLFDLFARNTVEGRILQYLADSKDLLEALLAGDCSLLN